MAGEGRRGWTGALLTGLVVVESCDIYLHPKGRTPSPMGAFLPLPYILPHPPPVQQAPYPTMFPGA